MLHNIDTLIAKISARGLNAAGSQKELKALLRALYEVRVLNLKDVKSLHTYQEFVYAIACNVPYSTVEEGQINKNVSFTETKQKQRKVEKGYFYLENLALKQE